MTRNHVLGSGHLELQEELMGMSSPLPACSLQGRSQDRLAGCIAINNLFFCLFVNGKIARDN